MSILLGYNIESKSFEAEKLDVGNLLIVKISFRSTQYF